MYRLLPGTDIRIYNSPERGSIKCVFSDFDGTISKLRSMWKNVMENVMVECICGKGESPPEIADQVRKYIHDSEGIQTILQMEALAEMVKGYGLVPENQVLDARGYKEIYNQRLMPYVRKGLNDLEEGRITVEECTITGAIDFFRKMSERGVTMHVFSGTDLKDVRNEATKLGVAEFFEGGIYGALDSFEEFSKKGMMKEVMHELKFKGPEVAVFGDGRVEIGTGKENNAITIAVASDDKKGYGWNEVKAERLAKAGCDIMIPDFSEGDTLLEYLYNEI